MNAPPSCFIRASVSRSSVASTSPDMARRSIPEEKLPPAPVRMHTRISGSSDACCHASAMRANICRVMAL
jgi:hypothetical protein